MFVTLEGPEGSGKTTLVRGLAQELGACGYKVLATREPGSGKFGAAVRGLLLHGEDILPTTELFLFLADRAQHVATTLRPALEEGTVVLCDRFTDSTVVYQGYGRGLDLDELRRMNEIASGGLKPELTLLLDLPPESGLDRIKDKDRIDNEGIEFHKRVREGFHAEAKAEPGRWVVIDASRPPEETLATALGFVLERLRQRG
ncbi:MAG: dTMP kinase [Fimbriimonadaceae bacterium]|nr:dTMP kinase [Fimbriimonadaceae bacterium]QYK56123.1 MAG: dTMP kinase [Fimbriimonadaceae bacterium]